MARLVVTFIGPPGAGKGFFSHWLVKNFNFLRLSSGDISRKYAKESTEIGKKIVHLSKRGDLLPDQLISQIFFLELKKLKKNIVLDGYPRTKVQERLLRKFFHKHMSKTKLYAIFLKTSYELSKYRVAGRLQCQVCGASYHQELKPPRKEQFCWEDNTKLEKRDDDLVHLERWKEYKLKTEPLIEHLSKKSKNIQFIEIDSSLPLNKIEAQLRQIVTEN